MPTDPLRSVLDTFQTFPRRLAGEIDLVAVRYLAFEETRPVPPRDAPLVLVLVEWFLTQDMPELSRAPLLHRLQRWADDLAAEGRPSRFLTVEFSPTSTHRDGEVLLSVRRLIRSVRDLYPSRWSDLACTNDGTWWGVRESTGEVYRLGR